MGFFHCMKYPVSMPITLVTTDAQTRRCFAVMAQLRPHLDADSYLKQVKRQRKSGYQMACLTHRRQIVCVAGFRLMENLAWGRFVYVDDLVTGESARSSGHGRRMFSWLLARARSAGCEQLHLDSGVRRFGAHKFYLALGMRISAHHFAMDLRRSSPQFR